jgi:chloramphenicol-sensitive protein RarD
VTIETFLLTPAAAACLVWWAKEGTLKFGNTGLELDAWIAASGVVTAVPLLFFGQAARRLPLSTLGFLQYIGPTVALFIAVIAFGEDVQWEKKVCFGLVWTGLVLLGVESFFHSRRSASPSPIPEPRSEIQEQPVSCGE